MEPINPPKEQTTLEFLDQMTREEYGEPTDIKRYRVVEYYPSYDDNDGYWHSGATTDTSEWFDSLEAAEEFRDTHKPTDPNILYGPKAAFKIQTQTLYRKEILAHVKQTWL